MRLLPTTLAAAALVCSTAAHAGLISGFENGLQGWDSIGDVSVQNAGIGLAPTQGQRSVFLSTMASPEIPFSGTDSPSASVARAFLGIQMVQPSDPLADPYMAGFPMADTHLSYGQPIPYGGSLEYGYRGESAAIKTQFSVSQAGYVSFDWDRIGMDGDNDYFTIWSDDLGSRINGWIYDPHTYADGFVPTGVDLCSHTTATAAGCGFYNSQTGWHTVSVWIDTPGIYTLGFGMNEIAESTAPTVLAIDNMRFNVPEPSSIALLGLGVVPLMFGRKKRCSV